MDATDFTPRSIEIQSTAEMHKPWRCAHEPPNRVWFQTENGWASREWKDGERAEYASKVLGR